MSYKKRSSLTSSFITGIVGWVGFVVIAALIDGYAGRPLALVSFALAAAVVQVVFLRAAFFPLAMDRGLPIGAFWGGLSGLAMVYLGSLHFDFLVPSYKFWLFVGAYVGAPVGAFLSYFYRDDRALEASGSEHLKRDEHWLEPFGFGAAAYLAVYMPSTPDLAFYVFFVGAMLGVFAAGSSHFSPDSWKESPFLFWLICAGPGSLLGGVTGLLFRQFGDVFWADTCVVGAVAGFLTYVITFKRGRQLARRERQGA